MRRNRATAPALLLCAAVLCSGCYTRHVREDVYRERLVEVFLRSDRKNLSPVEKSYDHPVTISAVRVAHILSRLDIRRSVEKGGRRVPAISTESLYSIADGISRSLSRADEDQEVVVMAIERKRSFKIFDQDYLTALVAYVRGEMLYIHLARSDWLVLERKKDAPPQPRVGDHPTKLKLYPDTAMVLLDTHSVKVAWRDPIFDKPTRTRILATGEVMRKTILLESPDEDIPEGQGQQQQVPPAGLSPGQLRALADLEEERLAGRITEGEYRIRQQEIVDRQ